MRAAQFGKPPPLLRPDKLGCFSGERGERGSEGIIVVDELSVEVSKSQVRLHFFHSRRGRPI